MTRAPRIQLAAWLQNNAIIRTVFTVGCASAPGKSNEPRDPGRRGHRGEADRQYRGWTRKPLRGRRRFRDFVPTV